MLLSSQIIPDNSQNGFHILQMVFEVTLRNLRIIRSPVIQIHALGTILLTFVTDHMVLVLTIGIFLGPAIPQNQIELTLTVSIQRPVLSFNRK